MLINIYVDHQDCEICQVDNARCYADIAGCDATTIETDVPIHLITRLDFKVIEGRLLEKSIEEKAAARAPTQFQIASAIYDELCATDAFMMPDRASSTLWATYRQTLRDLSKLTGVNAKIDAWPIRPDGADAIPLLRARVVREAS